MSLEKYFSRRTRCRRQQEAIVGFFRVQLGVVSRSDGHSATKRSAYQACDVVDDHTGKRFDFRRKKREHRFGIVLAPENVPAWVRDPAELWARAAAAERRMDAQEARIVDFSMPRAIPSALWEKCVCFVYDPLIARGMIVQADIHDTPASDGGRNTNVHGLVTLRKVRGDGFAPKKERGWNEWFRARGGRDIRELIALRLNEFCAAHGLAYEADARPNIDRNLPAPEQQVAKWNFEAAKRTGQCPEVLHALHQHRARRRAWEAAQVELEAVELEVTTIRIRLQRRTPRLIPADRAIRESARKDRKAAVLRAWHQRGWVDAGETNHIARARFDSSRQCLWLDLADGGCIVDTGDAVHIRGELTVTTTREAAAVAARHGWTAVEVYGNQASRDELAIACMLRGITVTNHDLSPLAQRRLRALQADTDSVSIQQIGGRESFRRIAAARKRRAAVHDGEQSDTAELPQPAYRPQQTRRPRREGKKRK